MDGLNEEEKESLLALFIEYSHLFRLSEDKLGSTNVIKHKIVTTDKTSINVKEYRYPHIHKDEIRKQTDDLLALGIVQPSISPNLSNIIWTNFGIITFLSIFFMLRMLSLGKNIRSFNCFELRKTDQRPRTDVYFSSGRKVP